jgi:hypothetical protein
MMSEYNPPQLTKAVNNFMLSDFTNKGPLISQERTIPLEEKYALLKKNIANLLSSPTEEKAENILKGIQDIETERDGQMTDMTMGGRRRRRVIKKSRKYRKSRKQRKSKKRRHY